MSTLAGRAKFVESAIRILEDYGLDGSDVDWEYAKNENEAQDYVELLKALRERLDAHATRKGMHLPDEYDFTIAAPCGSSKYEKLKVREMNLYLSFRNVIAYDYRGSWNSITGHQAALYDDDSPSARSTDKAVRWITSQGIPNQKLVLGAYDSKSLPLAHSQEGHDTQKTASWCYKPQTRGWVSYDTVAASLQQADWVNQHGFGGSSHWELTGDPAPKDHPGSIIAQVASRFDGRRTGLDYRKSKWDSLKKGMQ